MSVSPEFEKIHFLKNNHFIRNPSIDEFVKRLDFKINLTNYICYNVGYIDNVKLIQSFQIIGVCTTGIQYYKIRWWNTAFSLSDDEIKLQSTADFWVHSGVALRKNFFLFEDRFSLFRSSFLYDPLCGSFFRLFTLQDFLHIDELVPSQKIYHSPSKYTLFRVPRKKMHCRKKSSYKKIHNHLILLANQFKSCNSLQLQFSSLFREINLIIDGEST